MIGEAGHKAQVALLKIFIFAGQVTRPSRCPKDCCNKKQNSERHVSSNQTVRQKQTGSIDICCDTDVYATDTYEYCFANLYC